LAVSAALAAPSALAQIKSPAGSDWEFYGKFYPEVAHSAGNGATAPGTAGLASFTNALGNNAVIHKGEMLPSNSYIGFRGSRSMAGGTKAIWQLEQSVNVDDGNGNPLGNRDTFAGVATAEYGTVRLGNMDTPFKKNGQILGFLGVNSGNFMSGTNVLQKGPFGTSSASSFNLRRANSVDYASPTIFGGLQTLVQYSMGNPSETGFTNTPPRNPYVVSWAVKWEQGPLYAAFSQEAHFDIFGGSNNVIASQQNLTDPAVRAKDLANQVAVVYKIGDHSLEADVVKKEYKENGVTATATGKFQEYKNTTFLLILESRWSATWRTAINYSKGNEGSCKIAIISGAACSTSGLDGSLVSLGVSYYLDPGTYIFVIGNKITNGKSAQYNSSATQKPNPGEDITTGAIGLALTF
jgi:predicted porin